MERFTHFPEEIPIELIQFEVSMTPPAKVELIGADPVPTTISSIVIPWVTLVAFS
jgi:hypothetical protein